MKNIIFVLLYLIHALTSFCQFNSIDRFGRRGDAYTSQHLKENNTGSLIINPTRKMKADSIETKQDAQSNNITSKKFYAPLKTIIPTSHYGWRKHPVTGDTKFHTGIDLKAYYEPVYSIADGVVSFTGYGAVEGNYVVINHGQVSSVYCHLSKLLFAAGDTIKAGEVLGISGNTGRSTGPHLHFGVRWRESDQKLNPQYFLNMLGPINRNSDR